MATYRHLRDLRTGLLLRGTHAIDALIRRKAEICASLLAEARRAGLPAFRPA